MWANHFFLRGWRRGLNSLPNPLSRQKSYGSMIGMASAFPDHLLPHAQYRATEAPRPPQLSFSFQRPNIRLIPLSPVSKLQLGKVLRRNYGLWENLWNPQGLSSGLTRGVFTKSSLLLLLLVLSYLSDGKASHFIILCWIIALASSRLCFSPASPSVILPLTVFFSSWYPNLLAWQSKPSTIWSPFSHFF